jgi:delta24-sterol reductase
MRCFPELHRRYCELIHTYPLLLYIVRLRDYGDPLRDLCPGLGQGFIRAPRAEDKTRADDDHALFAELGAYGVPAAVRRNTFWDAKASIQALEHYARSCGGYQCLCFDTLQTEETFREMFDHALWNYVRSKYSCNDAFPTVYAKVRPEHGVL